VVEISIRPITLPIYGLDLLRQESSDEGYKFIERLVGEWNQRTNRFDQPGEVLLGLFQMTRLVGLGGLNRDPYTTDRGVGRIRHVYVTVSSRRQGLGETLVRSLLDRSQTSFAAVRLRTDNPAATRLYENLGFIRIDDPTASHVFVHGVRPIG